MQFPVLHQQCNECPIRHRAVCARCDADELAQLEQIKFYRSYQAGQPILWSGDQMAFVASVVSGTAMLTQTLADGRRQMVGLLLPSDFIGRPGRLTSPYDVTAKTDMLMCCFRRKPFEDLLVAVPHVAQRLLQMTLDELDAAREWMLLLGRKTAREKIASLIAIIARRGSTVPVPSTGQTITVVLPLTREEMADYLGLTLETVSRQISSLRQEGLIALDGSRRIRIEDFGRLLAIAGDDGGGAHPA